MYVYVFLAYVSGFQTLAHITWNHLRRLVKIQVASSRPKSFLFSRFGLGPENLLF